MSQSGVTISPLSDEPEVYWNRAGDRMRLSSEWRELLRYRSLLWSLVHRDLTVRYKRSALGFFWTMLHPLILVVIMTIVFSTIFRFALPHYSIYFLSEYVGWAFFSQTVVEAMSSFRWNGRLMKQARLPKTIFVLATTIAGVIHLSLAILAVLVIMIATNAPIRSTLVYVPVAMLVLFLFTLGVSMALSAIAIFFADVREMVQAFLPALMYLAPIIYPMSIIPPKYLPLIRANPLLYLLDLLRQPIYSGTIPDLTTQLVSVVAAIAAMIFGWLVFSRLSTRFYPHL